MLRTTMNTAQTAMNADTVPLLSLGIGIRLPQILFTA
jgi:hypothetical protein